MSVKRETSRRQDRQQNSLDGPNPIVKDPLVVGRKAALDALQDGDGTRVDVGVVAGEQRDRLVTEVDALFCCCLAAAASDL